jgi:hypothetical protein
MRTQPFPTSALLAIGATVGLVAFAALARSNDNLSGAQVRGLISGKRVYLATPLGTEIPLTYHANGALDGEVSGGLKFLQKSDSGNWWISGDRMCQKWRNWYNGRVYCFNLHLSGANRFEWHRNDGPTGRGRIDD